MKQQKSARWEDLTITNSFVFAKVMEDKQICKKLVETLLPIKIGHIKFHNTEKPLSATWVSKGVRSLATAMDGGKY